MIARGMRDNPVHVAVFGADAEQRERALERMFRVVLPLIHAKGELVGAFRGAELVGALGMVVPGRCAITPAETLAVLPAVAPGGPGLLRRLGEWRLAWARHDPRTPHWHLGPVAVDAHLHGQGIGSALMAGFVARMDAAAADAYLETDKAINVAFYRRNGFVTVGEGGALGVPCWYMSRAPVRRERSQR
jgi:ribosomal protein S18 acetylase RimI-like enzyme